MPSLYVEVFPFFFFLIFSWINEGHFEVLILVMYFLCRILIIFYVGKLNHGYPNIDNECLIILKLRGKS